MGWGGGGVVFKYVHLCYGPWRYVQLARHFNAVSMLAHCLRHWPNINSAVAQRVVCFGCVP